MECVLIVDDDEGTRESLRIALRDRYEIALASSGAEALDLLQRRRADVVLLDILMPGLNGLEVLKAIKEQHKDIEAIMISATTSVQRAIDAMKLGAYNYIVKPFDVSELRMVVDQALRSKKLEAEVNYLRSQVNVTRDADRIIGSSSAMLSVIQKIEQVADSRASVLITGDSGTGKELVARRLHLQSSRRSNPFVALHCATLPETLLESELFGHVKGAFTNAIADRKGKFELADKGTLFLDEIGEMTPRVQAKVLRVLQEGEFSKVGGNKSISVDVRIISATNRDLKEEIQLGNFREDLYYRINVVPIYLSPLKERRGDILELAQYFLGVFAGELNPKRPKFSEDALQALEEYDWPGNVRELKNVIERVIVLNKGVSVIARELLSYDIVPAGRGNGATAPESLVGKVSLKQATEDFEKKMIEEALRIAAGVQSEASRLLGTTRRILGYKIKQLGINADAPARGTADQHG
ncbi:MAG: sigma-54 dependent transcriptional regulator [bacterium]|nr:sigma-54 dependent transcriptional regulator [bacterium]